MPDIGPIEFKGGWNTKATAFTLPKDQYPDAQNVQLVYNDLQKRKGSAALNSSAFASSAAFHGLADWQTAAGQRYMVGTAGSKMGQMADLGGTFTDITGSTTITSGQNNQSTFASLNNILVRCGGTTPDAPIQWTGTGNASALTGSPPSGNICKTVNNFMFISGTTANPSRVYWSNVADPQTWGAASFADYRPNDGDRVTALSSIYQAVVIFKRRCIGNLNTVPPSSSASVTLGPLTTSIDGIGCVGSEALDQLPDGRIVFFSPNAHLYIYDGVTVNDISDPVSPAGSIQPTLDALPAGRLPFSVVRVYPTRTQIWISTSTGSSSTNNVIFVYDYSMGVWLSPFVGIAANVLLSSIDTRSTPSHAIVMLTGNYSGTVYEQDKGNTNAEDTNGIIDGYGTLSIQLGKDAYDFIPRSAIIPLESQGNYNLEVNYGYNAFSDTSKSAIVSQQGTGGILDQFILDTSVLGGSNPLRRRVNILGGGSSSSLQIQFRNRNAGQDFQVNPFFISDEVLS